MIEMMRFRLAPGVTTEEFLKADKALQSDFAYQQPGLLRRTTAVDDEGNWIVIDLWRSQADSDACSQRWDDDEVAQRLADLMDKGSTRIERYKTLD
jgi:hypothetical protein